MRWNTVLTGLAALAACGGLLVFRHQHGQLRSLRTELAALRAGPPAVAAGLPTPQPAAAAEDGLSGKEKLELLKLRAEVTRLRARQQELAPLRVENRTLLERAQRTVLPAGYVRQADAQFAGQATPEAALQSFFWAIANRDTNALFQILPEGESERLRRKLQEEGLTASLRTVARLPGYRVVSVEHESPTEVNLKVEIVPGEDPTTMSMRLEDGQWRFSP